MNPVVVRNVKIGEGIPKICVPIVGITKEEIIQEAKSFETIPVDVAEWRADWFEDVFDMEKVREVLKELRAALKEIPLLFTFRTSREGGEKAIEPEAYAALNKAAANRLCGSGGCGGIYRGQGGQGDHRGRTWVWCEGGGLQP